MLLALPVVVLISVLIGGIIYRNSHSAPGPLAVAGVPAPAAESAECAQLLSALPATLDARERRELAVAMPGVMAWGDPAVILRCGLPTPAELTCNAALTELTTVNGQRGVQWLQLSAPGATTYVAADRSVRIAVTLPDGTGSGAIQEVSAAISGALPSTARADGKLCTDGVLPPAKDR